MFCNTNVQRSPLTILSHEFTRRLVHWIDAVLLPRPFPSATSVPTGIPTTGPTSTPTQVPTSAPSETPRVVDNRNGFPCDGTVDMGDTDAQFTLNRSPTNYTYPGFVPLDESDPESLCFLRLTDDEFGPVAVSAWLPFTFSSPNNLDFSMTIGYRIFGEQEESADGMAFLIHQDNAGLGALGFDGGGIGYMNIQNALVVEWDTRKFLLSIFV